jgi:hypothetical protein
LRIGKSKFFLIFDRGISLTYLEGESMMTKRTINRNLKAALLAVLALSAAHVDAHTNKTFLMPRAHGVNLAMEYTTFNELVNRKTENESFGGSLAATGFYQESTNEKELGRYFGIKEKNVIKLTTGGNVSTNAGRNATDFDAGYIIHDTTAAGLTGATTDFGNVILEPTHKSYGARLDYFQDLNRILDGLYFKIALPIVHVENDLGLRVAGLGGSAAANKTALENYFKGLPSGDITTNKQANLTRAKFTGKQGLTGIADIDLILGYKVFSRERHHIALNVGMTVPTGNTPTGEFAFEPIYGNANHYAFGVGLDALTRIWGQEDHNVRLGVAVNYRYLFESREHRTLGISDSTGTRNFGQYTLLGNATGTDKQTLIPAANVTTVAVDVTPGSQVDGILYLTYNFGGCVWDLGYNVFYKERETVRSRESLTANTYGVAARNFDTSADFVATTAGNLDSASANDFITLNTTAAETPEQLTHKIYTGLGYAFKEWENPMMVGIGGSFEFSDTNSAIEGWAVWGKVGVGF